MRRPPALRNAGLRRLLLAQMPADFADWLDFVAIGALLAFTWQAEPFVFALLAVSIGAPYLLFGPLAGVVVDRVALRRVLILSNLLRGLVTAMMFLAPDWPVLLALVALRSGVDTFFTPAKQAAIQVLTGPAERTSANGLSHAINQASKIVAPALGGALLLQLDASEVFLVNAAVSILAAALALRLNLPGRAGAESRPSFGQDLRAGLNDIRGNAIVRAALLMMAAGYFAMFFYDTLIAPLIRSLGFTPTDLGLALASVGAGGVIGALGLALGPEPRRPFLWIGAGAFVAAVLVIWIGLAELGLAAMPRPVFLVIFGIVGFATALAVVPFRTILQNNVAEDRMGRVTALSEAANTLALLSAPFIGAAVAAVFGIGAAFVLGGAVMLLVAGAGVVLRNRR
ncbi:MFS transporter [Pontivivens ytuae]|uniref:MFS transporter n=1 Tax=Pontivivens ytuae TaxID=2789856 RepID=A0A7S9LNZ5_9RHOB|nr:MFS transporter [Pontivivens ytuae]QPH52637.1 MFS transporter [Pontivivens ytuae]